MCRCVIIGEEEGSDDDARMTQVIGMGLVNILSIYIH